MSRLMLGIAYFVNLHKRASAHPYLSVSSNGATLLKHLKHPVATNPLDLPTALLSENGYCKQQKELPDNEMLALSGNSQSALKKYSS